MTYTTSARGYSGTGMMPNKGARMKGNVIYYKC